MKEHCARRVLAAGRTNQPRAGAAALTATASERGAATTIANKPHKSMQPS